MHWNALRLHSPFQREAMLSLYIQKAARPARMGWSREPTWGKGMGVWFRENYMPIPFFDASWQLITGVFGGKFQFPRQSIDLSLRRF